MAEPAVFEIPQDVFLRLRDLSASRDVPLSTVLATAIAALLNRYSCEGTLAIRTTNPARSESWVGLLPMTTVIPDDPSFEQMLTRARQILPNRPESPEIEILIPPSLKNESQPHKLGFREESSGLIGTLDACLASMTEHVQMILRGVSSNPTAPISTISILGEQETRQILTGWNQTDCGYPQACLPELFEKQVQRTPNAVAVIQNAVAPMEEAQRLTYIQLDQQANRLANYLQKRGVGPEVLVGFCMDQSLGAVVAVLGILKAGGAYVPLDPSYPERRLQEIASDARLTIAVTSAQFRHRVPAGIETISVDRDSALVAAESSAAPVADITPDSAAYVLYTSASTGKPKGVVGIHRSILNGLKSVNYAPGDICCLNFFFSYSSSLGNLFLPLMSGVPVVILSGEQIRDANQMMTVLEKEGVTRFVLVPAVLQQILDPDFRAASRLRKITTIGVAGSRLTPSHLQRLSQAMPQAKLYNRYASTEIGTLAAIWNVTDEALAGGGEIPIGRPVANTRIYVLDRYRNPVPIGVVGEICVSAAHLARGYLNRPDLTQERFLPDPFRAEEGARLYRTGDLGRFRPNGEIEFVGRTDHQVKINGFRIDLPEVERVLASHSGVAEAVAAAREIGHSQRLVAYVVTKPIGTPSASQLRKYLQDRLPEFMVPSRFVFLNELNRNALPALEPLRPNLETAYQPPGTPMEAAIAQIWSELLGLEPIGIHDHFRDLGGDSISAAHVAMRLSERLGIGITMEAILERPTIAELATYLSGSQAGSQAGPPQAGPQVASTRA